MIRSLHRIRGASALGARHPGQCGPFGVRPDEDDDQDDEGDGPARKPARKTSVVRHRS